MIVIRGSSKQREGSTKIKLKKNKKTKKTMRTVVKSN
jgi:hypothetical protein